MSDTSGTYKTEPISVHLLTKGDRILIHNHRTRKVKVGTVMRVDHWESTDMFTIWTTTAGTVSVPAGASVDRIL